MPPKQREDPIATLSRKLELTLTKVERLGLEVRISLNNNDIHTLDRLETTINAKLSETFDLIQNIEELKRDEENADNEEIDNWYEQQNNLVKQQSELLTSLEEYRIEREISKKKMLKEIARVKEELNERKQETTKSMHSAHTNDCKAKLPRLQISKFDGIILDWVWFWE